MKLTRYGTARRLSLTAVGVTLLVAAAACDGEATTASAPPGVVPPTVTTSATGPPRTPTSIKPVTPTPTPTTPAGPGRCHTADLAARLGQPDSATGHTGVTLALTNRSTRPCRLYGYGGLQLLDATGHELPTRQVRIPQPRPQLIKLTPGASTYSTLYWVSVPMDKSCVQAVAVLVTPPDETRPIPTGALGSVCDAGRIQQTAYTAAVTGADRPDPGGKQAPSSTDRAAYARWQEHGAVNYSMRLARACFCPPQDPITVTVRDGKAVVPPAGPSHPTAVSIQDLFTIIFSYRADAYTVSYDTLYGFPRSLEIDYIGGAADDEVTYKITNYRPTSN